MHYQSPSPKTTARAIALPTSDGSVEVEAKIQSVPLDSKSAKAGKLTYEPDDKLMKEENEVLRQALSQPGNHFAEEAQSTRSENSPVNERDTFAVSPSPAAPVAPQRQSKIAEFKDESKKELDRREKLEEAPKSSNVNSRAANTGSNIGGLASSEQVAVSAVPSEPATGKAKEPLQKSDFAPGAVGGASTYRLDSNVAQVTSGLVLVPRWTLTADGTLQRSFNAGKSWETISVATDARFRALAAVGTEIWVGGSAGALYHSSDAGSRWTQVKPVADGKSLTADIIGVEFTDTQHGKLTTSGGVTWTTVDGGQTWNSR